MLGGSRETAPLEGTLGVVFTDIEGSTKLLRSLGDRFDSLLARHHELMRAAISVGGGVEVGTDGDAFFVLFERPADAVVACVAAQRALAAEAWPDDGAVRVRMGVHLGEVRRGGDNYTGLGVHQGARVAAAGHGGQIIVSAAAAAALGEALPEGVGLVDLGAFHLRDFDDPEQLFQVLHPDLERSFAPPRVPSAAVHNLAPPRTSFPAARKGSTTLYSRRRRSAGPPSGGRPRRTPHCSFSGASRKGSSIGPQDRSSRSRRAMRRASASWSSFNSSRG